MEPDRSDDAVLVAAYVDGDPDAFATIYDRYADRIHDFCHSVLRDRAEAADAMQDTFIIAARRLAQLRDPSKLRSWLFAIARNEAIRRGKKQARAIPVDDDRFRHLAAPDDELDAGVSGDDAREIVWAAAAGLNDRDRALLDLHLRQGLDGQELADAIGVTPSHAYVMMNRLRTQMERALGALLIARLGRDDCDELAAVLRGWDGTFSALIRKRVARHVDDCEVCGDRRRSLVAPLAAFAAIPALPASAASRDSVLDHVRMVSANSATPDDRSDRNSWRDDGFPRAVASTRPGGYGWFGRRRVVALLGASALVLGAGGGVVLATRDGNGRGGGTDIEVVASSTTDAPTSTRDPVSSTNVASTTMASSPTTTASPTTDATATVPPPTDPGTASTPEPTDPIATTTTQPPDGPPKLTVTFAPDPIWTLPDCGPSTTYFTANASDDHGIVDVSFTWSSTWSGSGSGTFDYDEPSWYGYLPSPSNNGYNDTIEVVVTAKDTAGQRATRSFEVTLLYCLG